MTAPPRPGDAPHWPRLAELLARHRVSLVFDVGANTGQYALALRRHGYAGRIVSYEPGATAHAALTAAAAGDRLWEIAPRLAVGAVAGEAVLNVSGESDMSSLRPLTDDAARRLASIRPVATETVGLTTLALEIARRARDDDGVFVKSDTQGYEAEVIAGLGAAAARVHGIQVELSLVPLYDGQPDHLALLGRLASLGFVPHLVVPGYWSRHHGRMIEYDVVCFRQT
ncbi:MAG: FkbM family methyltransferase [Alphaproteobacteria bacterium]